MQRAAGRAGWDEASAARFRAAVADRRISVAAYEQIALAAHWIQRAVMHVFLREPDAAPIERGAIADIIATCHEALALGDEGMRRIAAEPCCERPECGRAAIQRADAATAIRLDAAPLPAELSAARMRVASAGVPEPQREALVQSVAARAAWMCAADRFVRETVAYRLDAAPPAPTAADRSAARRDLASRVPVDPTARADAFAAAAHERLVDERAAELARDRAAAELAAQIRATLPTPPPAVEIPLAPLGGR